MATYTIYILQADDFSTGLPDESGSPGVSAGGVPVTLTVSPGASWITVKITDDDADFGEEITNGGGGGASGPTQTLAEDVTINGVTYSAGDTIVTAYDLIDSVSGHQITTFHIGAGIDGYEVGPVVGIVSTDPMPAGSYTFDTNRSSYDEDNPYVGKFVCFGQGTHISTPNGDVLIEDLSVGDLVKTLDHGPQPIRWIGATTVLAKGENAPVVIKKNALGNSRDLIVSAQHRLLLTGMKSEVLFGESEILCAATHLVNGDTIYRSERPVVTYFHMMFDTHEIVFAEGCPSESFHPGKRAVDVLSTDTRAEIFELFPMLESDLKSYGPSARPSIKSFEARALST